MTALEILTAPAIAIFVFGVLVIRPHIACGCYSGPEMVEVERHAVDYLAGRVADGWTRERRCSSAIDLAEEPTDSWDSAYRITCSERGAAVSSAGPDRLFGTPDDIHMERR